MDQRLIAAGDQQQQPLGRPAECRHQLGAILHGEPAGGSGPCIDQPAALDQAQLHLMGGLLDGAAGRAHRCDGGKLALDHGIQHVGGLPQIDGGIARAGTFGFDGGT